MRGPALECLVCGKQDEIRVCDRCYISTQRRLESIPEYYRKLGGRLDPRSGEGSERVSGGSSEAPLPVRLEPLSLRAHGGIVAVLTEHEDDWRELLGWTRRPWRGSVEQTVDGAATFLERNWNWCADKHPAPDVFAQEIRALVDACRLHTDGRSDVRIIGECPQDRDGSPCGAKLFAAPYLKTIRCFKCKSVWDENDWLKLARLMRGE